MSTSDKDSSNQLDINEANGFSLRLSQLVAELQISQNEFARLIGSTSANVSNMLRGKTKPGLEFLQNIANTFGISLDWLMMGKGNMYGHFYIDGGWLESVYLRISLAHAAACGDGEALTLISDLSDKNHNICRIDTNKLMSTMEKELSKCELLTRVYNQYLGVEDEDVRNDWAMKAAISFYQVKSKDPLRNLMHTHIKLRPLKQS